jgi:hypothetical protein
MQPQKRDISNDKKIPWNKGTKGMSKGGRKKEGTNVICTGCGRIFYKKLSKIVNYNFHSDICFKKFIKKNKKYPWSNEVYYKNSSENNHAYKGIMASCSSLHHYITYNKGVPRKCSICGSIENVDWSNQSGLYLTDLDDYVARCRKCHKAYDKKMGFPRKNCFDTKGRRIGITLFFPIEYFRKPYNSSPISG